MLKRAFHGTGHVKPPRRVLPRRGHARGAGRERDAGARRGAGAADAAHGRHARPTAPSPTGRTSGRSASTSSRPSPARRLRRDVRRRGSSAACRSPSCSDVDAAKERAAKLFAGYNGIPAYQRIRCEGGDDELARHRHHRRRGDRRGPAAGVRRRRGDRPGGGRASASTTTGRPRCSAPWSCSPAWPAERS